MNVQMLKEVENVVHLELPSVLHNDVNLNWLGPRLGACK